jgi:hypothetical protein
MSSSDEMYKLGARDAEHDDLNLFYYQHYYYYRKGYDRTRRLQQGAIGVGDWSLRRVALVIVVLAVSAYAVFVALPLLQQQQRQQTVATIGSTTTAQPVVAVGATATLTPTLTPQQSTPTPRPAPVLQVGGMARVVNVGESPLLARSKPGTGFAVRARFPQDTQVKIIEGPVQADGYTWWRVEHERGSGWSAEREPDGVVWLEPVAQSDSEE